jgi:MoaD family protein
MESMTVKVKFFAHFREMVGSKEVQISAKNIADLLEKLSRDYKRLEKELFENGGNKKPREHINIFVNGRGIRELNGLDTPLKDGDIVAIFPPVAGG